ncbi:MAG: hypothetical protein KA383_09975 [Phycisphaerae bacterium]|nr:hypothetical protein [Phycisphaerae bacterium]HQL54898.1 hypothetical protein [Phycisphaerae bacterium]
MMRVATTLLLVTLAISLAGCRALALFLPEQTKTVPAEYPYLIDKTACIVVRAPDELLFENANLAWEVADHVRVALEANVKGVSVVDPRKITEFQRTERDWATMDPAALGKRFGADRVLEIELTQYTTREPESPYLYRGHITAALRVYNTEYPNSQAAYQGDARTVYPPDGPGRYGSTDRAIRAATLTAFAQDVAVKFYDHQVPVR